MKKKGKKKKRKKLKDKKRKGGKHYLASLQNPVYGPAHKIVVLNDSYKVEQQRQRCLYTYVNQLTYIFRCNQIAGDLRVKSYVLCLYCLYAEVLCRKINTVTSFE